MTDYIWERNEQVAQCRQCQRRFSFFTRRHHCRRCGQIICDYCSLNRAILSYQELVLPPHIQDSRMKLSFQTHRICDSCVDSLALRNSTLHYSYMLECPVCTKLLLEFETKYEQEQHVQNCLSQQQQKPIIQHVQYIGMVM